MVWAQTKEPLSVRVMVVSLDDRLISSSFPGAATRDVQVDAVDHQGFYHSKSDKCNERDEIGGNHIVREGAHWVVTGFSTKVIS
jgi:hypothetical protein